MDISAINPVILIATLISAATPILLAAIGELVVEKSGVLNLGVEGMMITGAIFGFMAAVEIGSPVLGFAAAAVGGAALAMIFGILTQYLLSNQVATGLALTLFGLGFSSLLGQGYQGIKPPATGPLFPDALSDLPIIGPIVFGHDWVVYFALLVALAVWAFLRFTRAGLVLRAVGENHDAAHSLGFKVKLIRLGAIAFGGACAGVGGAYISLIRVPQWVDGMTAGAGWIALAIVVFGAWRVGWVLLGAYLFGGTEGLQLNLQGARVPVLVAVPTVAAALAALSLAIGALQQARGRATLRPYARFAAISASVAAIVGILGWVTGFSTAADVLLLSSSPYLITILVLVIISADQTRAALNAPGSLGRPFHASR